MENQSVKLTAAELDMLRCLQVAGKPRGIEVTVENRQLVYRRDGQILERKPFEYLQRMVEASGERDATDAQEA